MSTEYLLRVDVDCLRRAIYTVSVRHDWATTEDTEDRTQEIADEYEVCRSASPVGDDA